MDHLLIIDGNGIMFRAFFALPPMNTADGLPTNAIYGFFTMLNRALQTFHTERLIICFDAPGPSFRNDLLKTYQAQRPKLDDAFRVQIPIIKDLVHTADIAHTELVGYEADDLIGTLAKRYEKNFLVYILSADRDLFQLIDAQTTAIVPKSGISTTMLLTPDDIKKMYGVTPQQIPDIKALTGDASDNYKGAKGIGPKTATALIQQFGSVEQLVSRTQEIANPRIRSAIESQIETIIQTKKIATILTDVPISIDDAQTKTITLNEAFHQKIVSLQMNGLARKLFPEKIPGMEELKPNKQVTKPHHIKKDVSDQIKLF